MPRQFEGPKERGNEGLGWEMRVRRTRVRKNKETGWERETDGVENGSQREG